MSGGNLYQWFGYISNTSTGATTGVIGPLTADLNANGFNIINVGLLSAGDISTGGLTVNNCVTGPAGILKVCDQLDVENLANVGSLNVETTSTLIGDVDIQSTMHMPAAEPVGTLNLFSVTNISASGPPTSTPAVGALAFTDVDGILWVYDGSVWKDVITTTVQDLATTLATGNTSGANDIVMSSSQAVRFADVISILSNAINPIDIGFSNVATGPRSITMGNNNSTLGDLSINLGNNNSSNSVGGMTFGHFCTALPPDPSRNAFAWGYGSTATGNESISQGIVSSASGLQSMAQGYQAIASGDLSVATGRDVQATATSSAAGGHLSRARAANSLAWGKSAIVDLGADGSMALGNNSIVNAGHTDSVAILGSTTASNQIRLGVNHVVSVPGSVVLNSSIPTTATNNFLVLSKMLGIPTGAADSGAMTFDATNNVFYGRLASSWVPFQTGSPTVPPLATVLTAGNTTSGTNINVSGTDRVDFTSGMKLLGTNVLDLNNNTVMGIINAPAATGQVFVGLSTSATTANIVATTPLANGILSLESKGSGQIQLIASTNSRVYTPTYLISDLQESAGLQNAVTQTIAPGAPTTRIITGTQIYNFSVGNAFLMADVVNNRMNLRPNALYTVTSNFRYQEGGINHTNNVDLTFVMTYFDGTTANIIYRDTKSYPVAGPGSNGGYVQLSQLVKTNAAAVQWVALDLITNSSNGSLLISELRFQIAKVN